MQEEGCRQVIKEACVSNDEGERCLLDNIRGVSASLKDWSVNVLGDLEKRLKKAKKELEKWRREPINQ